MKAEMKKISFEYMDEDGYWIELAKGWKDPGDPVGVLHTIHTDTKLEGRREARNALPCDCDECLEKKFKVEVKTDGTGNWYSNQITFDTRKEAEFYGDNLFARWTAVHTWRVVEAEGGADASD